MGLDSSLSSVPQLVSSKVLIMSNLTLGNTVRQFLSQPVGRGKKEKKEKEYLSLRAQVA